MMIPGTTIVAPTGNGSDAAIAISPPFLGFDLALLPALKQISPSVETLPPRGFEGAPRQLRHYPISDSGEWAGVPLPDVIGDDPGGDTTAHGQSADCQPPRRLRVVARARGGERVHDPGLPARRRHDPWCGVPGRGARGLGASARAARDRPGERGAAARAHRD